MDSFIRSNAGWTDKQAKRNLAATGVGYVFAPFQVKVAAQYVTEAWANAHTNVMERHRAAQNQGVGSFTATDWRIALANEADPVADATLTLFANRFD